MAQTNNFPIRKKTPLDDPGLRLTAENLENGTGRPTLKVYPNGKNSCRFDIWSNLPGDKNDGRITADVPYGLMYVFLQLIQHYTEPSTPSDSSYIQIEGFTFYGGKRSDKPEVLAKLFAGKDEQGVIYISVQVADSSRPKIRFPLMDQFYSKIITQQGPMAKPLASAIFAKGYAKALELFLQQHCSEAFVDKTGQQQQNNQRNNNGGYQQQQQQNYQQSSQNNSSSDEGDFVW